MMKKLLTILTVFCLMFTSIPMMAGTFESNALAKNITLKASATGTSTAKLTWNKCKSPNSGYAVFRNGTVIGHYNTKKTSYSDSGLASGTSYTYQIKTYKKTTKTQWYNKKTGKWVSKKPAKKYRGKSRKVTSYSYKKKSNSVTIRTNYIYYSITWKNWDGSVLAKDSVKKGTTPSYSGSTPTKAADSNYTYTFKGWSPAVTAASANVTYTAQFTKKEKPITTYTITWKNWNGNTLRTDTVQAGATPSYGGTPTRPEDSNYTYTFKEWSPSVVAATSNATYTAQYTATAKPTGPTYYTIIWKNWDGTTLKTDSVEKGKMPSYTGTPTRPEDSNYIYNFNGWSPSIVAATANATYTAQYTATAKPAGTTYYTITWKNWDGSTLKTDSVEKGKTPSYSGTPTRPADSSYTYTFNGWSPSIVAATTNATYTAQYTATAKPTYYTITWKNWDGTKLKTTSVEKGKTPSYGGTPSRPADSNYTYTFSGWSPALAAATADATYTAQYTATAKPKSYTITWKNWDGSVLKTTTVQEGVTPSYGGTPTRPDDSFTYTFKGWSPSIVVATRNTTYTAEYTPKSKYNYDIKFISEPYGNGGKSVIFVETNNPNPYIITTNATNKNGTAVTNNVIGIPSDYADVQFTDEDEFYVGNGIPVILGPTEAGQLTFNVYEKNKNTGERIVVASRTATVKDYKAEEKAWRQRVIQNVCTNSMTNKEKMQAICGYILTNFRYLPNYRGNYVLIFKNEGIPYWVRKEIDSAGSPAALVDFGNDLGYPLENLFTKYEIGTPEWTQYHMCAYSAADDYYFQACPPSDTGTITSPTEIEMFNPDTYHFWTE